MKLNLTMLAAFSLVLQGCATGFTENDGSGYGYRIKDYGNGNLASVFDGNEYTSAYKARAYSIVGAFDHCIQRSKIAAVSGPVDLSTQTTETSLRSTSTPLSNGQVITNTYAVPVTKNYPSYATGFSCIDKFQTLKEVADTEVVKKEMVHIFKKDFKGGLLVKSTELDLGASGIKEGDVITKIAGKRIENTTEYYDAINAAAPGKAEIEIIREGRILRTRGTVEDRTERAKVASLKVLKAACDRVSDEGIRVCESTQ